MIILRYYKRPPNVYYKWVFLSVALVQQYTSVQCVRNIIMSVYAACVQPRLSPLRFLHAARLFVYLCLYDRLVFVYYTIRVFSRFRNVYLDDIVIIAR